MKNIKIIGLFSLVVFVAFSFYYNSTHRYPASTTDVDGVYTILGTSSELGDFSGLGYVKGGIVQRKIRFNQYKYRSLEVEVIYSGVVSKDFFEFNLNLSNVLTRFDNYEPTTEDFSKPLSLKLPLAQLSGDFNYSLKHEGFVKESWSRIGEAAKPLWADQRVVLNATGEKNVILTAISGLVGFGKVLKLYRDLPEVAPYKNRAEFKDAKHYYIQDRTDADFYLKNQNVIRVTNKQINPLALAEAMMRKNAYGQSLSIKEQYLSRETGINNLNAAGFLENSIIDENGKKIGRQTEYDTALWSSMFAWAELLKFQTTKNPDGMKNFRKVLDGILKIVEITGDPKEFARGLSVSPPEEDLGEGWIQGTGEFSHLKWRKGGNNDMVKGVFITLALAHQVVAPDEVELIKRIQKVSKDLALQSAVADRGFNLGLAKGLDALWNKDEKSLQKFYSEIISLGTKIGDATHFGAGVYYGGVADWSGVHLTMISNLSELVIARELQTVFPADGPGKKARKIERAAENRLLDKHKIYKPAQRHFLTLMAYAFSPGARENVAFKEEAKNALWALREVPAPRSFGSAYADLTKHPHWSMSAWPRLPWKVLGGFRKLKENPNTQGLLQGAYAYPLFESSAWSSTYLWKDNPFSNRYGSNPSIQTFSSDYLLMYWASRSSGLIGPND